MKSYAQEEMLKAILDEKQFAESRGDIDYNGYCCITLIVDDWCVRNKVFDLLCHCKWKDGKERSSVLKKLEWTINSNGK
ncbi:hypothetical protein TNIN_293091 [Trichonephila inaurata madagascariensis]|uniref:Uncharacterized protein n=1 Tax=Trichonephila inaurata madagascariensis TaxID=2747483 RepID=A0A8X6WVY1_9ARAC|nr:hypothetical protein TNIN_293091 [Trichonephila inaurata madagascariensis]